MTWINGANPVNGERKRLVSRLLAGRRERAMRLDDPVRILVDHDFGFGEGFEDPRLDRYMAAPPRKQSARRGNRAWVTLPARAGRVVLFESWLRHEVPPNQSSAERVSISFNYSWF